MPEKENATGGEPAAGGQSELGQDAPSQYSTENSVSITDFQNDIGAQGASIPFMITRQQRVQLAGLGYSEAEINSMTPSEAHKLLAEYSHPAPSTNGTGPHSAGVGSALHELEELDDQSDVDPTHLVTVGMVTKLVTMFGDYTGAAHQKALEALRPLIGALPAEDRKRLDLYPLFAPPKQKEQIESFLASCPPPAGLPVFQPMSLADLLGMPPKQWLIDQVIGAGDIAMLYGPPGSGKSFLVIDLVYAACLGRQWAMRFDVTRPLTVAYAAGEGLSGLPQRFAAAATQWGTEQLPGFTFFDIAPQLFTPERERDSATADGIGRFVQEWLDRQAAGRADKLDLLIIDTLHSATAGADENSSQDMGQVLKAVKEAARALGCAVLLVHHSNKAGTGERGSSAMRGAMDCMIEVKPTAGKFVMDCSKLKDSAAWKPQTFSMIEVGDSARVWWDEPGELDTRSGKQTKDIEAIVSALRGSPGTRYTATTLAEAIGLGGSKQIFRLLPKAMEANQAIRSGLKVPGKDGGPHNPMVYWWEP